jgi:hypothetical protein
LRNHRIALLRHGTNVRRNGKRRDQKYQREEQRKLRTLNFVQKSMGGHENTSRREDVSCRERTLAARQNALNSKIEGRWPERTCYTAQQPR